MLPDEDELLHAVSIFLIPIPTQSWIVIQHFLKFILWHGGVPLASISQTNLLASLLEYIADVRFILKPADTLAADDFLRPFAADEIIKEVQVESFSALIDERLYSVFQSFATLLTSSLFVVSKIYRLISNKL